MIITYEDWFDKKGYILQQDIEDWINDAPNCVDLTQLGIYGNGEDFIQCCLDNEYESFISDYIDFVSNYIDKAYDEYKDKQ